MSSISENQSSSFSIKCSNRLSVAITPDAWSEPDPPSGRRHGTRPAGRPWSPLEHKYDRLGHRHSAVRRAGHRRTRLFGTRGELTGDGETIRIYDFLTRTERLVTPPPAGGGTAADGHAGGDAGLMDAFTAAVTTGNRELISSGPRESLASHLVVFAAERARLNGTVETIPPYPAAN